MGKRSREERRAAERKGRKVVSGVAKTVRTLIAAAVDSDHPAEDLAGALIDLYRDQHVPGEFAFLVARKASPQRARALADAALALDPKGLAALTLAATVAEAMGDDAACVAYYEKALEVSPDPETRWCYAAALQAAGRNPDALDAIERLCREDPFDDVAQDVLRDALRSAQEDLGAYADDDPCPCGSGAAYGDCCRPRALAALRRFEDREPFDRLRQRIHEYAQRRALARFVERAAGRWVEARGTHPRSDGEHRLFVEWSWSVVDDETPEDDDEETDDCILMRFSQDGALPQSLRDYAREWLEGGQWGLWMVRDPAATPGVSLVDLLTGTRVYAAIPPEQLDGLVPWSVLFGLLVPVDGVWRTAATFVELQPSTADRLAVRIADMVVAVTDELSGLRRGRGRATHDFYGGLPPSAAAEHAPPAPGPVRDLFNKVVSVSVPHLYALLDEWTSEPPALSNTDGDPLAFLTAEIQVDDRASLRERLTAHPDFDVDRDEIVWLGREMSRAEVAVAEAEFKAVAERHGEAGDLPEGPHRYTRGSITLAGEVLKVQVNSQERLQALLDILQEAGARPTILSQVSADPVQDLGLGVRGTDPAPSPRKDERAGVEAWADAWVNEAVPALGGLTPRRAANDERGRVLLESLLRQFEYRAAANRLRGVSDMDVGKLRAALGMQ